MELTTVIVASIFGAIGGVVVACYEEGCNRPTVSILGACVGIGSIVVLIVSLEASGAFAAKQAPADGWLEIRRVEE